MNFLSAVIGQYLSNTNKIASVFIFNKKLELNNLDVAGFASIHMFWGGLE